jgi:hypothetical protein
MHRIRERSDRDVAERIVRRDDVLMTPDAFEER